MGGRLYSNRFMQYTARSSAYSAAAITSILQRRLTVKSVLDVGCARGTWLRAWKECGVKEIRGVDGEYVDRRTLEIPVSNFTAQDLGIAFDLKRQFDLVQSLEVGEHIEKSLSGVFADNLVRHARTCILFSAAPPGQGGENHINEQPYEFWRKIFESRGFATFDVVRPLIVGDRKVSYWYRYNTILFVRRDIAPEAERCWQRCVLAPGEPVRDISPLPFRIRKALIGALPQSLQHEIARLKARIFSRI